MDNVAKQSRLIMIGNKVYIEKTYSAEPGIIKWYLVSVSNLAVGVYPFKLKPHERLENEVEFMRSKNTCFNKQNKRKGMGAFVSNIAQQQWFSLWYAPFNYNKST